MKRLFFFFCILFLISGSYAEDLDFTATNLGLEIPDSWFAEEVDELLIAGSPDEEFIILIFSAGEEAMFSWGLEAIEIGVIDEYFTEFEVLEENELVLDGLTVYEITGTGLFSREQVSVSTLLIMADPGYAYVVFIGTESGWKIWDEEMEAVYTSIHSLSEW